jgi:methylamine---glutamate N-methyltransferase subunit B
MTTTSTQPGQTFDLESTTVRVINQTLQGADPESGDSPFEILAPAGAHNLACGLTTPVSVHIRGHVGYYCGGMNEEAQIRVEGHAGTGLGENMMSGRIEITGNASQCAGASAHGGLLVINGDASARCGISLKGGSIVVKGKAGAMSGFLAQKGNIVICGDAGENLGDSLYEVRIYVKGKVASLGTDCIEKEMRPEHLTELTALLTAAGCPDEPSEFRRYGSERKLYHFHVEHAGSY